MIYDEKRNSGQASVFAALFAGQNTKNKEVGICCGNDDLFSDIHTIYSIDR